MSQPAAALAPLPFELVYSDGEPLETNWHCLEMNLFIEVIRQAMAERGRTDFFAGGNMFVYYSVEQARDIADGQRLPPGPSADPTSSGGRRERGRASARSGRLGRGRAPARRHRRAPLPLDGEDRPHGKRDLYARVFRTAEYFLYEPDSFLLKGSSPPRSTRRSLPMPGAGSGASASAWRSASGTASTRERRPPGCASSIPTAAWCQTERSLSRRSASAPTPRKPGPPPPKPSWRGCALSSARPD